jgi:hypothetical protein
MMTFFPAKKHTTSLKLLTVFSFFSIFYAGSLSFAENGTVTIPVEDYKAILQRLDALQKRVEFLESNRSAAQSTVSKQHPSAVPSKEKDERYERLAKDINIIYDTMDDLETKKLQNKINFGAELRTRIDTFKAESFDYVDMTRFLANLKMGDSYFTAATKALVHQDSLKDYNTWSNRFRITMDAEVTDTIDFHGRLSAGGYWGDSDSGDAFFDRSQVFLGGHQQGLGIDRFYINWLPQGLPIPFALTIGRQPSSEGPPFEIKENTVRQSTYPSLLFNGIADGIVATFGLDKITGLDDNGLRFAYGKAYHSDSDSYMTPVPFMDDGEAGDSDIYAAFFESKIPGLKNSLMVFSYARLQGLPTAFFGPLEPKYYFINKNLGNMDLWGAHFQAKNIKGSGLDIFFSYAGNHSSPSDPTPIGLLSWGNTEENDGYALYAGLNYTIPYEPLNHPKIGFEYNHGSKYWYSMTVGCPDPFNKLATRGSVYDAYYIQPVNKYLFFRAGYTRVEYDYTGSGTYVGTPGATDMTLDDIYLLMDIHF